MSIKKYHNISYPGLFYYQKCVLQKNLALDKFCRCIDILYAIIYKVLSNENRYQTHLTKEEIADEQFKKESYGCAERA